MPGELVLLLDPTGKRHLVRLAADIAAGQRLLESGVDSGQTGFVTVACQVLPPL